MAISFTGPDRVHAVLRPAGRVGATEERRVRTCRRDFVRLGIARNHRLADAGPVDMATIGHDRALAAALALASTSGLMVLLRVVHPPAGATTMIVALGFITSTVDLGTVEASIVLLTCEALIINRLMPLRQSTQTETTNDANRTN